jgi:hypothetical protein
VAAVAVAAVVVPMATLFRSMQAEEDEGLRPHRDSPQIVKTSEAVQEVEAEAIAVDLAGAEAAPLMHKSSSEIFAISFYYILETNP